MLVKNLRSLLAAGAVVLLGGVTVGMASDALAANQARVNAAEQVSCTDQLDIRTGYYRSSNGQPSSVIQPGIESLTQYHSMADASVFPGYQKPWITALNDSVELSYALEFKYYGATVGPQTINGKTVPAPNAHIQKRDGTGAVAYGYGQMTSGALDPILDRINSQIKTMVNGRPNLRINWQIASEVDTDHEFGTDEAGTNYTPAQSDPRAVQAITYMINYLRDHALPENVTFTIGMAGIWRDRWLGMHPPSLAWIVDGGLQYNAYNHSVPSRTPYQVFNMTKAWTIADLSKKWQSKPIVIEEWGTPSSQGSQAAWLAQVPAAIARMNSEPGPKIERMNYFDSNDPWGTFIPRAEGEAAYAKLMADPVFEPCSTVWPSPSPSSPAPTSPSPSPTQTPTVTPTPTRVSPSPTVTDTDPDPTPTASVTETESSAPAVPSASASASASPSPSFPCGG